jgi:hypothetical protein
MAKVEFIIGLIIVLAAAIAFGTYFPGTETWKLILGTALFLLIAVPVMLYLKG